ncbi:vWA domain-containing protein [Clostridium omnivorum]|uniref:Peptidase n=1 Tax=Clostridium omnivorum TaxID=1604902 RepID=A0ABQ5N0X5_9CLOT|nr:VWA-like domain-containing protein [Clostridium sp. E14]GLC28860.1 peptidase [Clostridium sp. E14]
MLKENKFDFLRRELLSEVYNFNENENLNEAFNEKFYKLIEMCTFSLMRDSDNFFALFIIQMKREIKLDLSTAIATIPSGTYFTMYFNPMIFLECTLKEMQALIKHEVYHILSLHYIRAGALRRKYSTLAINVAMDISINQYIINLPVWCEKLETARLSFNVDLDEEETMEKYAEEIQYAIDRLSKEKKMEYKINNNSEDNFIKHRHNEEKTHDLWNEKYEQDQIKELIKKTANNAAKGKLPDAVEKMMKELNKKADIGWKEYLKRMLGTLPSGHKKTVTRKSRRQPDRLDLRGKLSRHIAQIIVAIDISGSISDKEIEQIMIEVFSMVKNYPSEITIIECDSEIRRIYKVKDKKDIRQKLETKGSTKFSPVFQYINENNMRNHLLIYFTDGIGERQLAVKPINYSTLWVLTGKGEKLSLEKPFGVIKKLSNVNKIETDFDYAGKEEMKEYRNIEWAK